MGFRNKDLRKKLGKEWKTAKVAYELRKLRVRITVKKAAKLSLLPTYERRLYMALLLDF